MAIQRTLVNEGLLLQLLFGRPLPLGQGDHLWELFLQGQVRGYVTDFAPDRVERYGARSHPPHIATVALDQVHAV